MADKLNKHDYNFHVTGINYENIQKKAHEVATKYFGDQEYELEIEVRQTIGDYDMVEKNAHCRAFISWRRVNPEAY